MPYMGNYLRGAPSADTGMPSILGLQQYIQQGFDRGRAQGQNQQLSQLSQAAFNDTGDQQQQDVSKAIGVDPKYGYALAGQVGAQSAQQQQQMQLKRYGGVASAIFQAKQHGNNAGAEGLYQSVLPELAAMASKSGGAPPPANLDAALADPKISGTMYQLAQMYGGGLPAAQKGVVIAPGGQLVNPTTGSSMASVPNRGQVVGGYYFDPNTGKASPIPITGAQNGVGMAAPVPGATAGTAPQASGLNTTVPGASGQSVAFNFPPGTPPEVIAAAKASAVANGDISQGAAAQVGAPQGTPQGAPGAPTTLAQAMASKGAPTGLIAQRSQQIAELKARGVALSPSDEQAYLVSGKLGPNFQGAASAPVLGDITKTGTDYLASLNPADRDAVTSYLDGRQAIPTGTALKNPLIQSRIDAAYHADPDLEGGTYSSRVKTRQAFTSATGLNSPASQIRTLNTASGHLNQLLGDVLQLDNGTANAANYLENGVASKFGSTKFTNLKADLTPVVSEVASLYKGGQATDAEIKSMMDSFPVNGSKSQQISVIERWIGLLHSKLGALNTQYTQGMGPLGSPLMTVSPQAAQALQNITQTYNTLGLPPPATIGEAAHSAGGDAAQPSTSAPAPSGVDSLLSKYGIQ